MKFELEVVKFDVADVITASTTTPTENSLAEVCGFD